MSHPPVGQIPLSGLLGFGLRVGFFLFRRLEGGVGFVGHAINPDRRDPRGRIKEPAPGFHHGQVGELSRFQGAQRIPQSTQPGWSGGQGGQCLRLGEPMVEGGPELGSEGFPVRQGVGGQGDG